MVVIKQRVEKKGVVVAAGIRCSVVFAAQGWNTLVDTLLNMIAPWICQILDFKLLRNHHLKFTPSLLIDVGILIKAREITP